MNWVWPKAPAQEPNRRSGRRSPRWMICSVASSSPLKKALRRGARQAPVESACTSGQRPLALPKSLSTPQTAAMV